MRRSLSAVFILLMTGLAACAQVSPPPPDPVGGLLTQLREARSPGEAVAIEAQIRVLWLESGNETADELMAIGVMALDAGDPDVALAAFDRVVALAPDFAEGWNKRGTANFLLGDLVEAFKDVKRALALEPRHFGALSGLGVIFMIIERDQDALAAFEAALALNPFLEEVRPRIAELRQRMEGIEV